MVTYALFCHGGEAPRMPVRVRSMNDEQGWHAFIFWPGPGGGTMAASGPFTTRREAVLALRNHLRERRHA